jgi:4-nitrophenyl phosphatase
MIKANFLRHIKAILIDIDGTLVRGNSPLPGLVEFFDFLNHNRVEYRIASNNSTRTPAAYYEKLTGFGADLTLENILTSSTVAARYLSEHYLGCTIYVVGQEGIHSALEQAGFTILTNARQTADVVVVGGDNTLTYEKLKNAALHLQRGAHFIGTNPDLLVPTEEGLAPECGTILAALEAATGKQAVIMGKPYRFMFELGLKQMGCQPREAAIIGDRLETDITGGAKAGMKTILVETGIDNPRSILEKGIQPDLVVKDLPDLIRQWQSANSHG